MSKSNTIQAQKLLYIWISSYEKRSYTQIKEACAFMNDAYDMRLEEKPVWELFYPMVFSGVIDHIGEDYYALTKPIALAFEEHAFLLNCEGIGHSGNEYPIGYTEVNLNDVPEGIPSLRMNSISVLKSFPSVDSVIDSWETSVLDEEQLTYHDFRSHTGVAEYTNGHTRYFSIPEKNYLKEMPARRLNPDAYSIGISYERALNGLGNGRYNKATKELSIRRFAFPVLLYRALSIDGMSVKLFPTTDGEHYIFKNISSSVAKEINRILCKSIVYE